MPYPALPDMRMNYDNDGTLVYYGQTAAGASTATTDPQRLAIQDIDLHTAGIPSGSNYVFFFFPEQREITGIYSLTRFGGGGTHTGAHTITGSNDTTNGLDGTWETASKPGGDPTYVDNFSWRSGIKAVSFTGPKKNIRLLHGTNQIDTNWTTIHLYGEAAAGQMAHDLVFIDHDTTPGVAFTAPEDFGDQPLGTTVVRQFRIKNTSASRTATNLNIQLNDADFVMAEAAGGPWVVTINVASLLPGAETATFYVRCTTPAPGAALGPRVPARILVTCDAGFFG